MEKTFTRITQDVQNKFRSIFSSKYKKAGLNWFQIRKLKYTSGKKIKLHKFGETTIHYKNGIELLYSLKEIFVDDIYKMIFQTETPLIIDCGANIGLSILYMKKKFPSARIIAFEPDMFNYDLLEKNTGIYKNIELRNQAVWNENTKLYFENTGTMGSSVIPAGKSSNQSFIDAIRLKDLLTQRIDFLKLDIEGAEFKVIEDCRNSLHLIENLFIEYHGNFNQIKELNTIFEILRENAFFYYIKEAANVYPTPFYRGDNKPVFDIQLNIFCFKSK